MTEYAKPDSLPFRSYYFQQRRKKRKAANALVQRYITSLSAAGGMYYELSEPVVIGAGEDFEVSIKYSTTNTDNQILIGDDFASTYYFNLDAVHLTVWVAGTPHVYEHKGNAHGGIVHEVSYILSGNSLTVILDGASLGSKTISPYTGVNNFLIGTSNTNQVSFTGEIYDLKIWTGGDRNTGTLVLDMPIDEDWTRGTVVHNMAADLGAELVSGDLAKAGNATLEGNTITNTGGWAYAYYDIPTEVGKTYLVSMDVSTTGATKWAAKAWAVPSYPILESYSHLEDGRYVLMFTAITTITRLGAEFSAAVDPLGCTLTVNSMSAQKIPTGYPFATAINVTENEADLYTLINDGTAWQSDTRTIPIAQ